MTRSIAWDKVTHADVLRAIARDEVGLIEQAPDRLLLLGPVVEREALTDGIIVREELTDERLIDDSDLLR